jgi:hypothetical protein
MTIVDYTPHLKSPHLYALSSVGMDVGLGCGLVALAYGLEMICYEAYHLKA